MIVFTIASKNFMSYVLTLHESLMEHHRDVTFYCGLCDEADGFDLLQFPFEVLTLDRIGITNLPSMKQRYNITELNTSIKPFLFSYLFDRHPGAIVTYIDPDILVASPMVELAEAFEQGANCVLTPHILEPAEFAEMEDRKFLQFGIYNLGILQLQGYAAGAQGRRMVGATAEEFCVIDLQNGLFVDQKWADLLPAFIDRTEILRHPGYNAAYWNLSQRTVRFQGENWTVNNLPLRFFHFSGNKIEDVGVFSRHSSAFTVRNIGDLKLLLDKYRNALYRNGHRYYSSLPYGFNWNGSGGENIHTPVTIAQTRSSVATQPPHLPLLRLRDLAEYAAATTRLADVLSHRREVELNSIPFDQEAYTLTGACSCCGVTGAFQASGMYSPRTLPDGRAYPNWREHLNCMSCGLVNRVRASLHVLQQAFFPSRHAKIYITERITPTYDWLKKRYPETVGSEYFVGDHVSGDLVNGVLHQDVQILSFPDKSFQFILTFDVLEHVPDPSRAWKEFYRCLEPGGVLMITVPFRYTEYDDQIRAVMNADGEVEHIMEPEYHGNPVDMDSGSLCFRYFGWQLLDELREIGFSHAEVLTYWSQALMHFGEGQLIIVATKGGIGGGHSATPASAPERQPPNSRTGPRCRGSALRLP